MIKKNINLVQGDKAPDFELTDQEGNSRKLSDLKGKWVLLYFYPKDFTSGCTAEACSLRDNFNELGRTVTILGISSDSSESHKKFADKYTLPFTLLADPQRKAINLYGADGFIFAKRVSFLINEGGMIEKVYNKVDPKVHASQILEDLKNIRNISGDS
jgi:thioredoxin-dependent peroxiredoxin